MARFGNLFWIMYIEHNIGCTKFKLRVLYFVLPGGSVVKNPLASAEMEEMQVQSLG